MDNIDESFKEKINFKKIIIITSIILLTILSIIVYARYKATSGLIIHEYKITDNSLPESFHGTKIVQFSDIYYGNTVDTKYLKKIIDEINNLNPDIVIFTGDLLDKEINNEEKENITNILSKINAKFGKYKINGDKDTSEYQNIMSESGFIDLNNTSTKIYYNSSDFITLTNIDQQFDNYTIYLLHIPHEIDNLNNNYNLILAGHTLGGQINLPLIKNIFLPNGSKKYNKNQKEKNLYISSGIGTTKFKYRFLNKPSINLYRLTKY